MPPDVCRISPRLFSLVASARYVLAGLIGEGYGSLIGGGSIVMQPVQVFLGVPLKSAIAIDNASALGTEAGILSETYDKVQRNKRFIVRLTIPLIAGGLCGTWLLLTVSATTIKYGLVAIMLALLIYINFIQGRFNPGRIEKY